MESGNSDVAGITEIGHVLVEKHVPVYRSVWIVALRTALSAHGEVFIEERPLLVGVALEAHLLLEPAELAPA